MKRLLIILLFLIIPFSFPSSISAQCTVKELDTSNIVDKIIALLFGLFNKTDYSIQKREINTILTDMNDYGNRDDENFDKKHAFAGSRSQDYNSQNCLKGNVIKQAVMGTEGYENTKLAQICLDDNCSDIRVNDLANYFVQFNQPFYCDYINNTNQFIEIETDIITKVQSLELSNITENQKSCYQQIYDDFYITPKNNDDVNENNTKKIIQTILPMKSQDSALDNKKTKQQVDDFLTPASYLDETSDNYVKGTGGINGLVPERWKI